MTLSYSEAFISFQQLIYLGIINLDIGTQHVDGIVLNSSSEKSMNLIIEKEF